MEQSNLISSIYLDFILSLDLIIFIIMIIKNYFTKIKNTPFAKIRKLSLAVQPNYLSNNISQLREKSATQPSG